MDPITKAYMTTAVAWANSSNYNKTHVGAVVVGKGRVSAGGCNQEITIGSHMHAEVSAILAAYVSQIGGPLKMYATWAACPVCASAIIRAGITEVHVLQAAMDRTPERWVQSVQDGLNILLRGGVEVIHHGEKLGTILRMDGEWFDI